LYGIAAETVENGVTAALLAKRESLFFAKEERFFCVSSQKLANFGRERFYALAKVFCKFALQKQGAKCKKIFSRFFTYRVSICCYTSLKTSTVL
jgi:hypothetical protein